MFDVRRLMFRGTVRVFWLGGGEKVDVSVEAVLVQRHVILTLSDNNV